MSGPIFLFSLLIQSLFSEKYSDYGETEIKLDKQDLLEVFQQPCVALDFSID